MKNAIHGFARFCMLAWMACFPPLLLAAPSACEEAYFSPDDFNHAHPLQRPPAEFVRSYKLAMAGNAMEQRNVAVSYDAGYLVTACPEKADYWYREAARNGDQTARNWVSRNNLFQEMLDGPESVGIARSPVAFNADDPKNKSSQGRYVPAPLPDEPRSLAAESGKTGAASNRKIAVADTPRVQMEKPGAGIAIPPTSRDAARQPAPSQEAKVEDRVVQEPKPVPAALAQPSGLMTASAEATGSMTDFMPTAGYGQSNVLLGKGERDEGGMSHAVLSSPPSAEVLDISLERAINIARERSFRLGRSQRNIDGALARYMAATALYLPRFDSTLYATQTKHQTPYIGPGMVPQNSANLNFGVTLPLDFGGIIGHQVAQAGLARRAAEYDLAQSQLDVAFEVEVNYYNALRAQEIARVDKQIVDEMERLDGEAGEISMGISNFIRVELANARQTLASSNTVLDLSMDTLKQSLRLPPGTMVRLTDKFGRNSLAMDGAQALQEALAKRPDIGQIGVRIEQMQLAGEQVYDVRKPTLSLQAYSNNSHYSRLPGSLVDNPLIYDRGLMLTLNMPLAYYDWGYLRETKKSVVLQSEQARFDMQEQRERVGLEVRQAVIALRRAEDRVNTLPDLELAHDALRRAERDFLQAARRGEPASPAQMSNARSSSRLAEIVTIDALYEYNLAIFNLKHAIGALPGGA